MFWECKPPSGRYQRLKPIRFWIPKGKHLHSSHGFVATAEQKLKSVHLSPETPKRILKKFEARQSLERTIFAPVSLATSMDTWSIIINMRSWKITVGLQKAKSYLQKSHVSKSITWYFRNTQKSTIGCYNQQKCLFRSLFPEVMTWIQASYGTVVSNAISPKRLS